MGYDRYRDRDEGYNWSGRRDSENDRDYGGNYGRSSARDYAAAGEYGRNRDTYVSQGSRGDSRFGGGRDWDRDDYRGSTGYGAGYGSSYAGYGSSYGTGSYRSGRDGYDSQRGTSGRSGYGRGGYDRRPEGYDYQDRGFLDRAGDEVRSWFGDDEAERRREQDARYDAQHGNDDHYRGWRDRQMRDLDRDYDEYRRENATKFENEFGTWRTDRQGQRTSLSRVTEHMEVVGSDGQHVGTVDKVRGDRIILTKNDADAGGHHHSIPSRWIQSVDDKVTIRKSADEAKSAWKDEEQSGALFGDRDDQSRTRYLNRSFSGTY